MSRCVWYRNLNNEEALAHVGPQRPQKWEMLLYLHHPSNWHLLNCLQHICSVTEPTWITNIRLAMKHVSLNAIRSPQIPLGSITLLVSVYSGISSLFLAKVNAFHWVYFLRYPFYRALFSSCNKRKSLGKTASEIQLAGHLIQRDLACKADQSAHQLDHRALCPAINMLRCSYEIPRIPNENETSR